MQRVEGSSPFLRFFSASGVVRPPVVDYYGRASWMSRRRPGKPTEMRSDLPSHVMSVRTTTSATSAIVRRRGTVANRTRVASAVLGQSGRS